MRTIRAIPAVFIGIMAIAVVLSFVRSGDIFTMDESTPAWVEGAGEPGVQWGDLPASGEYRWGGYGPAGLNTHIDTSGRSLTLRWGGTVVVRWVVAVGKVSTPTPHGSWVVTDRGAWGGAFGARWMGLSIPWGRYGVHGTNRPGSIGGRYSAGCVRMFNHDVVDLFEYMPVGTPVVITGEGQQKFGEVPRAVRYGYRGTDVLRLQQMLSGRNLYVGPMDGIYGHGSLMGIKDLQQSLGWEVVGDLSEDQVRELGIDKTAPLSAVRWFEPQF